MAPTHIPDLTTLEELREVRPPEPTISHISGGHSEETRRILPPRAVDFQSIQNRRQAMMARGYTPIRVHSPWTSDTRLRRGHRGKKPLVFNWMDGDHGVLGPPQLDTCNTGILTSGLRVIDVDVDDRKKVEKIVRAAEHAFHEFSRSMMRTRKNSPRVAIIFRAADGTPQKLTIENDITGEKVEVLGDGQQVVVDGYHQSSLPGEPIPFQWHENRTPWNWRRDELGAASDGEVIAFREAVEGILGIKPGVTPARDWDALAFTPEALARVRAIARAQGSNNELSSGIEGWFDQLDERLQREVVLHGLDKLDVAGVNRTRAAGGGRDAWIKIGMALAHSGLSDAEDLWIEWSRRAPDADDEGELSRQFHSFRKNKGTTRPITIGTLLKLATDHGADFSTFRAQAGQAGPAQANGTGAANEGASAAEAPDSAQAHPQADHPGINDQSPEAVRPVIRGGTLDQKTALSLMNALFFVAERDGETGIFRVEDDGALTAFKAESFALKHNNTFVRVEGTKGAKSVPITKWWLAHPLRRSFDRLVFEPKGQIGPDDYNLWRGFAIEARPGYQKQRRLLRHIWQIICRRDKAKFGYLMRWLAWAVQNPHRSPETIVVLLSGREGSGKSTLGEVMLDVFGRGKGRHGLLVDDKEQLLGRFNAHLETTSFVLAEEIMWAGDYKTADAIKSRITASVIPIEEKFGLRRQVPNRLHTMITTNHEWAVSAGEGARRYFVAEVSNEKAQDPTWFDPLRRDLGEGGLAEFLHLLLNLRLGPWHPRNVPKTEELAHQQLMSAGSVEQWLLACADADAIVDGLEMPTLDLPGLVSSRALFRAYCAYMRQWGGGRAVSNEAFGRVMKKICGVRKKLPASQANKRPWGYAIPDADSLGRNVRAKLNVQGN